LETNEDAQPTAEVNEGEEGKPEDLNEEEHEDEDEQMTEEQIKTHRVKRVVEVWEDQEEFYIKELTGVFRNIRRQRELIVAGLADMKRRFIDFL
jgi:hypothetical protein